jgi:hypothetical protein
VTLVWTGPSLADVAVYVADGRAMALPLLAEGLIHDWNFILGRLGLLGWDAWIRVLSSEPRNSA